MPKTKRPLWISWLIAVGPGFFLAWVLFFPSFNGLDRMKASLVEPLSWASLGYLGYLFVRKLAARMRGSRFPADGALLASSLLTLWALVGFWNWWAWDQRALCVAARRELQEIYQSCRKNGRCPASLPRFDWEDEGFRWRRWIRARMGYRATPDQRGFEYVIDPSYGRRVNFDGGVSQPPQETGHIGTYSCDRSSLR